VNRVLLFIQIKARDTLEGMAQRKMFDLGCTHRGRDQQEVNRALLFIHIKARDTLEGKAQRKGQLAFFMSCSCQLKQVEPVDLSFDFIFVRLIP